MAEQYNRVLCELVDRYAPEQTRLVTVRPRHVPWITDNIKVSQTERRRLERRWRSLKLTMHHQMFTHQQDVVSVMCKEAKREYYQRRITDCGSDQRKLYHLMDDLLQRKGHCSLPTHNSSKDLADRFCAFFTSKIDGLREKLITVDNLDTSSSPANTPALSTFTQVTDREVSKIISASPAKSCCLDPLPTCFLKSLSSLVPTITVIVNKSLGSGTFPAAFKSALVRPFLKKSMLDPEVLRNYRPVSNLAFVSKVLEKVVAAQLTSHIKEHGLDEKNQSAYCCHHSTETALVKVQNNLLRAIDEGCGVFLVLLGLSVAFDTLDHDILLKRLEESVGLSGLALRWMDSYLRGRSQSVTTDGNTSDAASLKYGIPHGSVLGPLLFTIYTIPIGHTPGSMILSCTYMPMTPSYMWPSGSSHPPHSGKF